MQIKRSFRDSKSENYNGSGKSWCNKGYAIIQMVGVLARIMIHRWKGIDAKWEEYLLLMQKEQRLVNF